MIVREAVPGERDEIRELLYPAGKVGGGEMVALGYRLDIQS